MTGMIYNKIEVIIKVNINSTSKLSFENSSHKFESKFLIISSNDAENNLICNVFDLETVKSYKLYNK